MSISKYGIKLLNKEGNGGFVWVHDITTCYPCPLETSDKEEAERQLRFYRQCWPDNAYVLVEY